MKALFFAVANLLGNFGPALTYEVFIHLGLLLAIPISAGEISPTNSMSIWCWRIFFNSAGREPKRCWVWRHETGRNSHDHQWFHPGASAWKLARLSDETPTVISGTIFIIRVFIWRVWQYSVDRWGRQLNQNPALPVTAPVDLRTGYISRSRLRSPSGRVRWPQPAASSWYCTEQLWRNQEPEPCNH